jgi:hypothetical protein
MEVVNSWQKFAQITVETNDLDPMYQMMRGARGLYGDEWVMRYCMHMLMFYHAGEAVQAAEEEWTWGRYEYEFDNLKRGTERRHFRGVQGRTALARLREAAESPMLAFLTMWAPCYTQLRALFSRGHFTGCGFGDYFAWKVLDLQTRVFDRQVTLTVEEAAQHLPTEPREAAAALFPSLSLQEALIMVRDEITNLPLPFGGPGFCDLQEAETVLCMIKGAFLTRTHQIGDDIEDKKVALQEHPELSRLLPFSVLGRYKVGKLYEVEPT